MRISLSFLDLQGRKQVLLHICRIRNIKQNHGPNFSTYCFSKVPLYQRLVLGLQRNSANSAMWSEDHSGEGRAVSFLKLFSSKSSNKDSTVNVSAKIRRSVYHQFVSNDVLMWSVEENIKDCKHT